MNIRTVLLDDDINSRKAARVALDRYQQIEIVGEMETKEELLSFLMQNQVDLLFLDIELEKQNGFEIADFLQNHYPELLFVFLTGHASYAIDGYDFKPINFLTKPINPIKLDKTINEVVQLLDQDKGVQKKKSTKLMLRCENGYEIVDVSKIIYVERANRKNYMYTDTGKVRIYNYSIKDLCKILEPYHFFCCHQSYIISLNRVRAIRDENRQLYCLELQGSSITVPLSRGKYEECRKQLRAIGMKLI